MADGVEGEGRRCCGEGAGMRDFLVPGFAGGTVVGFRVFSTGEEKI
jgi:hypothetical protein